MTLTAAAAHDRIAAPAGIDAAGVAAVLDLLTDPRLDDAVGGALLSAWAARGETAAEVAALVRLLRAKAITVDLPTPAFDLCGTGGSGLTRYNVSTTVAFILAAAGVPVAKHGNVGSQRPNGSFDLLKELGVPFQLPPSALTRLHVETGVCFLFARAHHPAVGAVARHRKAAGRRTIFNLAGPLANPAPIAAQLIGVAQPAQGPVLAGALAELGVARALVVQGHPGIDEWSVLGPTQWWRTEGGRIVAGSSNTAVCPGLGHADLPGGDALDNAHIFQDLLGGREQGPLRELVLINAGVALDLWSGLPPLLDGPGRKRAAALLDSGAVGEGFARHRALAQRLAAS